MNTQANTTAIAAAATQAVAAPVTNVTPIIADSAKVAKTGNAAAVASRATKTDKGQKEQKAKVAAGAQAFDAIAKRTKATMVTVGGTDAEPLMIDAADAPRITAKEVTLAGSTLQSLAFNFMAGTVDPSINEEFLKGLPRAMRNEKSAIGVLLGKKSADIRQAWETAMVSRKRKDTPTLRALASLMKSTGAKTGAGKTWKEKVADILDSKRSEKLKLQMLRELIAD